MSARCGRSRVSPPKTTDVANAAFVQDVQGPTELIGVNPAQVAGRDFATGKVAEIARCSTGVRNADVAESRTTAVDELQHGLSFGSNRSYGRSNALLKLHSTLLAIPVLPVLLSKAQMLQY
jgi:hypothetical protein